MITDSKAPFSGRRVKPVSGEGQWDRAAAKARAASGDAALCHLPLGGPSLLSQVNGDTHADETGPTY